MPSPTARIKNHHKEQQLFLKRTWVSFLLLLLGFFLIVMQLLRLQWLEHERFVTLSHNNRVSIHPIEPKRGLIFDRNGLLLAENVPQYSLQIRPDQVRDLKKTIQRLQNILPISQMELDQFYKQWHLKRRFLGVPLKDRLTETELAQFAVHRYAFPGVELQAHLVRHYPYHALLTHVLGYVGRINAQELTQLDPSNYSATTHIGKTGLEKFYENQLHGQVGFQAAETDAKGRIIRILSEKLPIHGQDLHLTLDWAYQRRAMELLEGMRGVLIAMHPKTGEILAFVSSPSFDPNPFVAGIDPKAYAALQTDPNRPLYNRALRGLYAPASLVKPLLALEALDNGIADLHQRVFDPGWYQLKGDAHQYRCWKRTGHGWVNLTDAIIRSCDIYFYQLAPKLGIDRIEKTLKLFGFGVKTGLDLPDELSGLVPSRNWKQAIKHQPWYPGETLIHVIGQGFTLVTPLQVAAVANTLANQGTQPTLHLLQGVTTSSVTLPYSAQAFEWLSQTLPRVFSDPTGTSYRYRPTKGYTLAGKTGTAQVVAIKQNEKYNASALDERFRDHSWFMGYAPAHDPQIALVVLLENQTGSARIARAFLDTIFEMKTPEDLHAQASPSQLAAR